MGHPMGCPIPTVSWDDIGMGPVGGILSHSDDMGLHTDQVVN